ncbi:MAG TPA: hypothetical protein VEZ52_06915, partial [Desulfovibrio sp.]|uniref:hypothetical protein n=1 Tax=Desulfovibrio sp. TaxID=885 RepID=UPI002D6DC207
LEHIEKHDHRQDDYRPQHQVATYLIQHCLRYVFRARWRTARPDIWPAQLRNYYLYVSGVKCLWAFAVQATGGSAALVLFIIMRKTHLAMEV